MANQLYAQGKNHLLGKTTQINLLSDNILVMFYAGTFSNTHEFISDLTGASIIARSGNLAGKVISSGVFDANDITITGVTGSAFSAVVLAKTTGTDSSSPLIAWYDVSTFTPSGSNVTVVFNAAGLFGI